MNKLIGFNEICPHMHSSASGVTHKDYVTATKFKSYFYKLFYVINGTFKVRVNDDDYILKKNSLILFSPNLPFKVISMNNEVKWITVTFTYTHDVSVSPSDYPSHSVSVKNFESERIPEQITFTDCEFFNDIIYIRSIAGIKDFLLKCVYEQSVKRVSYDDMVDTLFHHILIMIKRNLIESASVKSNSSNHIDAILDYIQKNYDKDLSNKKIGEIFYLHPNYINKLMAIYTNQSLHQYILGVRISNAKQMFEASDMKISEVAEQVGYSDLSLFSKNFKKIVGKSPREFLKMIK